LNFFRDHYRFEKLRKEETTNAIRPITDTNQSFVRYLRASADTVKLAGKRLTDRRIQKTQNLLRQALVSFIHEKPYDTITVTEILQRANVGKSRFYMHFQDKDELLASGIYDMLRSAKPKSLSVSDKRPEKIIWFSLPIFVYLYQHRRRGEARMGTRSRAIVHEHLRSVIAELIADDVREQCEGRRKAAAQISPDLLVQYAASTFILVLNWWVESRSPLTPNEGNDLFHALILPTLTATLA
jgi:AcrR family transcriptional regulator